MKSDVNGTTRLAGIVMLIAGILMVVAGSLTWATVSNQLEAEHITVAKVTDADPGRYAGEPVDGPLTAFAQANAINVHSLEDTKGRTYAQLGNDIKEVKAKLAKAGVSKDAVNDHPEVQALNDARDSSVKGSFLRASLFTSVVAFGVAALVVGLGVLFGLLGFTLIRRHEYLN